MSELYLDQARYFPVKLGNLTFYAQSYQISGVRNYTEQATVSGGIAITNTNVRARRILLEGKLLCQEDPSAAVMELDRLMEEYTGLSVEIHRMWLIVARIVRYTVQEVGTDSMLSCRIELISDSAIREVTL